MSDFDIELSAKNIIKPSDIQFEFLTNNVEEISPEVEILSLDSNIEINPICIDIEITGLRSYNNKFIGLEDTPFYYQNGKFFKVEDDKIVYTDIQWSDIIGNLEDNKELIDKLNELSDSIIELNFITNKITQKELPDIKSEINIIKQLIQEVTPKWKSMEDLL